MIPPSLETLPLSGIFSLGKARGAKGEHLHVLLATESGSYLLIPQINSPGLSISDLIATH